MSHDSRLRTETDLREAISRYIQTRLDDDPNLTLDEIVNEITTLAEEGTYTENMNEYLYSIEYRGRTISILKLEAGNYGYIDLAGTLQTTRGAGSSPLTSTEAAEQEGKRDIDARMLIGGDNE